MATQYRFSFGPWNLHEGADPFGPPVRPPREFVEKLDLAVKLGFQGIQFHDDDVIPADLPAEKMEKAVAEHTERVYLMGPMFADMRRDPRFERVRQLLGL